MPRARFFTICPRCDLVIALGDRYVIRKDQAIHPHCAPGADDD